MDDNGEARCKSRIVAILLSLCQPGLGHLYALRARRAVLFAGASLALAAVFLSGLLGQSFSSLVIVLSIALIIFLGGAIDAARCAPRSQSPGPRLSRWYAVLALAVAMQWLAYQALPLVQRLKSFYMPSSNMEPTIVPGDRLFAALAPSPNPRRGDIVLFESPETPGMLLLNRVIALPGETIEIRDKAVLLNGALAEEPWAQHLDPNILPADYYMEWGRKRDQLSRLTLADGQVFVMGDNRDFSHDSRFYGPVDTSSVRGKPLYVYWSQDRERIGLRLDQ
ncbi:MAG: signal peptidase I [Acidobacteriota bacterium]|nr:signal peptidase I [Acidobacteriota bacterium]